MVELSESLPVSKTATRATVIAAWFQTSGGGTWTGSWRIAQVVMISALFTNSCVVRLKLPPLCAAGKV